MLDCSVDLESVSVQVSPVEGLVKQQLLDFIYHLLFVDHDVYELLNQLILLFGES